MNLAALLCALLAVIALAQGDDKYTEQYDDINVDEILNNDRLLNSYKRCLVGADDSKCSTKEGKFLRSILGEGLAADCAKCTDKQKSIAYKSIKFLNTSKPDIWKEIATKYDPNNEFLKKHPELTG